MEEFVSTPDLQHQRTLLYTHAAPPPPLMMSAFAARKRGVLAGIADEETRDKSPTGGLETPIMPLDRLQDEPNGMPGVS